MKPLNLTCRRCGLTAIPIIATQTFLDGSKHVRANCRYCNGWIKFLPKEFAPERKSAESSRFWWDELGLLPATRAFLKQEFLNLDHCKKTERYLIEIRHHRLLRIADRLSIEIQDALNKRFCKSCYVVFYSLEPLIELAKEYGSRN